MYLTALDSFEGVVLICKAELNLSKITISLTGETGDKILN